MLSNRNVQILRVSSCKLKIEIKHLLERETRELS